MLYKIMGILMALALLWTEETEDKVIYGVVALVFFIFAQM